MNAESNASLKEKRHHGTKDFHCAFYLEEAASKALKVEHHWHNEVEIVYMEKGAFSVEINMEKYEFQGGGLLFLNAGELHYICSKGGFRESAVVFDPKILSFDGYDLVQRRLIQPLLNGGLKFPRYIGGTEPVYLKVIEEYECIAKAFKNQRILAEEKSPEDGMEFMQTQLEIKAALLKIFSVLSKEELLVHEEGALNQQVEEIKKILSFIHGHYAEKIYIKDLAGILNVNEQYFCRLFKKVIGKSAMEYVNEVRIKRAEHLLLGTNAKVVDVCLESGFHNLGNFLREFKKHTGTTPHAYRKEKQ